MGSENICVAIDRIQMEDLYLVEQDLSYSEKVSIGFLLFADNKPNAEYILQRLLILSSSPRAPTDILLSFAKLNKNWKPFLVEALAIIQANSIIRKLGLNIQDVRLYFFPHIPELSHNINQILKGLYSMCESMTSVEAGELVLYINDSLNTNRFTDHLRFYDHLEVFLLHCIVKNVINVSGGAETDINILVNYFKLNDMIQIKEMLTYILRHLNLEKDDGEHTSRKPNIDIPLINNDLTNLKLNAQKTEEKDYDSDIRLKDCYKIDRNSAGFVLIINQENFYESENENLKHLLPKTKLTKRLGTEVDKILLKKTFSSFGYKPVVENDLNHNAMLSTIREVVKHSIIYDSLIVCILSHGAKGSVYGCDSIPIKIAAIEKILAGDSLMEKPKMLFIQACQGDVLQRSEMGRLEADGPDQTYFGYRDMVKAVSTIPGYASLRNTQTGSWFIQILCAKVEEFGDRDHILDILTKVNDAVSKQIGNQNETMTSISSQTLRKQLRLPSRSRVKV